MGSWGQSAFPYHPKYLSINLIVFPLQMLLYWIYFPIFWKSVFGLRGMITLVTSTLMKPIKQGSLLVFSELMSADSKWIQFMKLFFSIFLAFFDERNSFMVKIITRIFTVVHLCFQIVFLFILCLHPILLLLLFLLPPLIYSLALPKHRLLFAFHQYFSQSVVSEYIMRKLTSFQLRRVGVHSLMFRIGAIFFDDVWGEMSGDFFLNKPNN